MMVGLLGAWRLGSRLALTAKGELSSSGLLDWYEHEQRVGSEEVQRANALIFRNMAVANPRAAALRSAMLHGLSHAGPVVRRMTETEALVTQKLPVVAGHVRTPRLQREPGKRA